MATKKLAPDPIVIDEDGEADTEPAKAPEDPQRQGFVDSAAIALYASGWPTKTLWDHAEYLWTLRQLWLAKKGSPR